MEFELEDPLTSFQDHQSDTHPILFASESDHMPSQNFLTSLKTSDSLASFRREAISYMSQVINSTTFIKSFIQNTIVFLYFDVKLFYFILHSFPATWTRSYPTLLSITWTGLFQSKKSR